ncbi:MAG: trypsin-like peptidase domain-containing protein, partial [Hominilimicola sp.]
MKKQIIAATALMLAISSTAYASDNINIFVNGNALNTGAFIMNDSTYIPLRAVSEALGSNVNWDGNTSSVYIDSDEDTVTAQVIENASSSVVAIVGNYKPEYMTGTVSNYNELTAHGTGVVIKSGGIILTNAHVVSDIDNITVVFSDGESYAGQVQAIDKDSDLALVKVCRLGLKPISFAQSDSIFAG